MSAPLINLLLFQISWFAAIFGGAAGWPMLCILPSLVTVGAHLISNQARLLEQALLILAITLLGLVIETGFMAAGVISYAGTTPAQILPPIWIIALWFAFGTLPAGSLAWLGGRWKLQALLGAVLGPVSYVAGARLGAATLADPGGYAMFGIGLAWALALPAMFLLTDRLAQKSIR